MINIDNIKINLNCKVKIKLSEYGKKINEILIPSYKIDEEGYIELQLWKLMQDFGPAISGFQNYDHPFEDNDIEFIDGKKDGFIKINESEKIEQNEEEILVAGQKLVNAIFKVRDKLDNTNHIHDENDDKVNYKYLKNNIKRS